jgi:hypothetical protein
LHVVLKQLGGRAIAQPVSRRLPIAATRVRVRVWSCEICDGQSCTGAGFLWVLRFPLPILISPTAQHSSSSIIRGCYNTPVSGRQTRRDLTWARTRAAAVGSQRLTAWTITRPTLFVLAACPKRPPKENHALGLFIRAVLMKTHVNFNYVKSWMCQQFDYRWHVYSVVSSIRDYVIFIIESLYEIYCLRLLKSYVNG